LIVHVIQHEHQIILDPISATLAYFAAGFERILQVLLKWYTSLLMYSSFGGIT